MAILVLSFFAGLYLFFESRYACTRKQVAIVSLLPVAAVLVAVLLGFAVHLAFWVGPIRVDILQAAGLIGGTVYSRKVLVPKYAMAAE